MFSFAWQEESNHPSTGFRFASVFRVKGISEMSKLETRAALRSLETPKFALHCPAQPSVFLGI